MRTSWPDGGRYDGPQPVDGWLPEQDVVGGIGIYHQISNLDSLAHFTLVEGGI